jgi:hypothetical protein
MRRLPIDDRRAAYRGVHDETSTFPNAAAVSEQTLDVELVGDAGANGDRCAARGQDLLDRGFGFALVAEVDHDDGVAPARELPRDLAADPT